MKLITTSWDDGHELDGKLANLLHKHGLKATFYIPKTNAERSVMPASLIKELAAEFEIGGHTLNHVRLQGKSKKTVQEEVKGCYDWLSDLTGIAPVSFCFPGGAFDGQSLETVLATGFKTARTTELLSVVHRQTLVPTTLQCYPHNRFTYFKHLAKRRHWQSLIGWLRSNAATDLIKLAEHYLNRAESTGGCFHLWGHSWEIEQHNLWPKLAILFQTLANREGFHRLENRELTAQ